MPKGVYKHKPLPEETKRKISLANKGRSHNYHPKTELKKGNKLGRLNKGIPKSEEHKKNISLSKTGKCLGSKSPNWKEGISKDKEYQKELRKKWRKKNYHKVLWLNNQRRVKKMGNGGSHTLDEWETLKAQYNFTCLCCHKSEPNVVLSRDHIIPLFKGGSDNIENIQPLCRSCNSKKHTTIIKYI